MICQPHSATATVVGAWGDASYQGVRDMASVAELDDQGIGFHPAPKRGLNPAVPQAVRSHLVHRHQQIRGSCGLERSRSRLGQHKASYVAQL